MIEAKEAVRIANERGADMLERRDLGLEEIERDSYKDRDVWMITLSFPRDLPKPSPLSVLSGQTFAYKRFLIDASSGELLAIKLRETAEQ